MNFFNADNPWVSIWISPRETIRNIIASNKRRGLSSVPFLLGTCFLAVVFAQILFSKESTPFLNALLAIFLAWPIGVILIISNSIVIAVGGKILKGKASFDSIVKAIMWSYVPLISTAILSIIVNCFYMALDVQDGSALLTMSTLLVVIGQVWTAALTIITLSEVQQFSKIKAFFSYIVGYFIISLFVIAIILVFGEFATIINTI